MVYYQIKGAVAMPTILCVIPVKEEERRRLEAAAPGYRLVFAEAGAVPEEALHEAEVILGNIEGRRLGEAPGLRWVQLNSAGADPYLLPGVLPAGVVLTNATGAYGPAVAEHLLAMTLQQMKRLHQYRDNQNAARWRDEGPVTGIAGSVFLVVGLGDIGGAYGRMVAALGGRVIGVRRHAGDKPPFAERVVTADRLDDELPGADVVALCLPGGDSTRGLFSAERLARMKRGAYLFNVGRGSAVDSLALCGALAGGHLAGAGLDVTDPEPLPPDHPLWREPHACITPHVSGWYHMEQTRQRVAAICEDNLRRFVQGEPLRNVVDPATGYRRRE